MSYLRFRLDLAIKEPIPQALKDKLPAIRREIRRLKSYASKINEGKGNEEITVTATYHICDHDNPANRTPCVEEEI